jgi:hypothetical protein
MGWISKTTAAYNVVLRDGCLFVWFYELIAAKKKRGFVCLGWKRNRGGRKDWPQHTIILVQRSLWKVSTGKGWGATSFRDLIHHGGAAIC